MRVEHEPNMPALRREWLGARVVGAFGLIALLALGVLIGFAIWSSRDQSPTVAAAPPASPPGDTVTVPTTSTADARRQENIALCTAALEVAQKQGILPAFATLASDETQNTDVQGRYICLAKTDAARYSVDFDLTCTNLSTGNCISLYNISQAGGGAIYQRK